MVQCNQHCNQDPEGIPLEECAADRYAAAGRQRDQRSFRQGRYRVHQDAKHEEYQAGRCDIRWNDGHTHCVIHQEPAGQAEPSQTGSGLCPHRTQGDGRRPPSWPGEDRRGRPDWGSGRGHNGGTRFRADDRHHLSHGAANKSTEDPDIAAWHSHLWPAGGRSNHSREGRMGQQEPAMPCLQRIRQAKDHQGRRHRGHIR